MTVPENAAKELRTTRLLAGVMFGLSPLVLVVVAGVVKIPHQSGGQTDMVFYMLLVIAMVQPAVLPLVERFQIANYRRQPRGKVAQGQLATSIYLTKFALIEGVFVYGLATYFITANWGRFLVFYPIGFAWIAVYWPRREAWLALIQKLEAS